MHPSPKNITPLDLSVKHPNDAESDYKAEVIAAFLIEQGYNPEQIAIIREGTDRRGFSTDVSEVEKSYSMHSMQDYLHFKANKEGIYDMLPKGIFHQPVYKKQFIKDKEDALEEIKIHREEEFYARRFFQPFEITTDVKLKVGASAGIFWGRLFDVLKPNPYYEDYLLFSGFRAEAYQRIIVSDKTKDKEETNLDTNPTKKWHTFSTEEKRIVLNRTYLFPPKYQ